MTTGWKLRADISSYAELLEELRHARRSAPHGLPRHLQNRLDALLADAGQAVDIEFEGVRRRTLFFRATPNAEACAVLANLRALRTRGETPNANPIPFWSNPSRRNGGRTKSGEKR